MATKALVRARELRGDGDGEATKAVDRRDGERGVVRPVEARELLQVIPRRVRGEDVRGDLEIELDRVVALAGARERNGHGPLDAARVVDGETDVGAVGDLADRVFDCSFRLPYDLCGCHRFVTSKSHLSIAPKIANVQEKILLSSHARPLGRGARVNECDRQVN